jgi:hypothetical protein
MVRKKEPEAVASGSNGDAPVSVPPSEGVLQIEGLGDTEAVDYFLLG